MVSLEIDGARCQCLQALRYTRWGGGTVPKLAVAARILDLWAIPIGRGLYRLIGSGEIFAKNICEIL